MSIMPKYTFALKFVTSKYIIYTKCLLHQKMVQCHFFDTLLLRRTFTLMRFYFDALLLWCAFTLTRFYIDALLHWHAFTSTRFYFDALLLRHAFALTRFYFDALLLWCAFTSTLFYIDTLLLRRTFTLTRFYFNWLLLWKVITLTITVEVICYNMLPLLWLTLLELTLPVMNHQRWLMTDWVSFWLTRWGGRGVS